MGLFKFTLRKVIPDRIVDCKTLWSVQWNILQHKHGPLWLTLVNSEVVFRAFTKKQDATDFAKALEEANKLIQNETYLGIKIVELN